MIQQLKQDLFPKEQVMSKKSLTLREKAIIGQLWIISLDERDRLDRFFLLHDSWEELKKDISFSEEQVCYFLQHEGQNFQIVFMTPLHRIKVTKELGLSFRQNWMSSFHVVLIKEWREANDKPIAVENKE